jgi:hypothetical protein
LRTSFINKAAANRIIIWKPKNWEEKTSQKKPPITAEKRPVKISETKRLITITENKTKFIKIPNEPK